ncbi:1-acyl-sn-glycerol-3-phosphate acyltransferase [Pigmentiphaga humi]|uniref:1-acyl-sn-glycerol-3-phosphate acyltransferase n=1 Tax=Pigmentiphaga humi TaxID=2478468 RepID=A0A3P4B1A4_9BURK|nr:lysophospholipid acyltransferase family protein [Pigmentiphaga humi]VCU70067.1 1-acyl-sn-glycerol-3-phosphate acyltransferase [Pigmentiphaga humi]
MVACLHFAAHLLRFTLRFLLVALWVIFGLLVLATVFRRLEVARRDRVNNWWSRWLLRWCGVRVYVSGRPPVDGPALLIANHVSWLDIYALSSVRCTIFVGKRELRDWPVLGWLIAGVGTVFIERGNRRAVHHVAQAMGERFGRGQLIGLFPEGTTSDGLDVLPFHAGLFEPARRAGVPVLPVALRYLHHGKRSTLPAYVGDESLLGNAWRVLGTTGVAVQVVYLPSVVPAEEDADHRHAMATRVREAIRAEVLA